MPAGMRSPQPATDFHYRATGADFRVAGSRAQRSRFRDLSAEFLAQETKRDYRMEALCFVIIASVSAWPIVAAVRALALLP